MVLGTSVAAAILLPGLAGAVAKQAGRSKYVFAVALAHNRIDVSADMISQTFDIRPSIARNLLSKLVCNGVVDAPNAQGIARLSEPLQRIVPQVVEYNPAGGYLVKGRLDELATEALDIVKNSFEPDQEAEAQQVADPQAISSDADRVPPEA
ncbi:MAG: hypothetical protein AAFW87_04915 [Pseudomonadota bacterium]